MENNVEFSHFLEIDAHSCIRTMKTLQDVLVRFCIFYFARVNLDKMDKLSFRRQGTDRLRRILGSNGI